MTTEDRVTIVRSLTSKDFGYGSTKQNRLLNAIGVPSSLAKEALQLIDSGKARAADILLPPLDSTKSLVLVIMPGTIPTSLNGALEGKTLGGEALSHALIGSWMSGSFGGKSLSAGDTAIVLQGLNGGKPVNAKAVDTLVGRKVLKTSSRAVFYNPKNMTNVDKTNVLLHTMKAEAPDYVRDILLYQLTGKGLKDVQSHFAKHAPKALKALQSVSGLDQLPPWAFKSLSASLTFTAGATGLGVGFSKGIIAAGETDRKEAESSKPVAVPPPKPKAKTTVDRMFEASDRIATVRIFAAVQGSHRPKVAADFALAPLDKYRKSPQDHQIRLNTSLLVLDPKARDSLLAEIKAKTQDEAKVQRVIKALGSEKQADRLAKASPSGAAQELVFANPETAAEILKAMPERKAALIILQLIRLDPKKAADILKALHALDAKFAGSVIAVIGRSTDGTAIAMYDSLKRTLTPEELADIEAPARLQPGDIELEQNKNLKVGDWRPQTELSNPNSNNNGTGPNGPGNLPVQQGRVQKPPKKKKPKKLRVPNTTIDNTASELQNDKKADLFLPQKLLSKVASATRKPPKPGETVGELVSFTQENDTRTLKNTVTVLESQKRWVQPKKSPQAKTAPKPVEKTFVTKAKIDLQVDFPGARKRQGVDDKHQTSGIGNYDNADRSNQGIVYVPLTIGANHGGHVAAARFIGKTPDENIHPQNGALNSGAFKDFESYLAQWVSIKDPQGNRYKVEAVICVEMPNNSVAPDSYKVKWQVKNANGQIVEQGEHKFLNKAGQKFVPAVRPDRIDTSTVKPLSNPKPNFIP